VSELFGAPAVGVPRAVHRVAIAQETLTANPLPGGAPTSLLDGMFAVPGHLVPDPLLVRESFLNRALVTMTNRAS
jgi:hypothetical protein